MWPSVQWFHSALVHKVFHLLGLGRFEKKQKENFNYEVNWKQDFFFILLVHKALKNHKWQKPGRKAYSILNTFVYMRTSEDINFGCILLLFSVSDSTFKSLDSNWLYTKLGEGVFKNDEWFLLYEVQRGSLKPQKICFHILGSFLSNKIEIIKD